MSEIAENIQTQEHFNSFEALFEGVEPGQNILVKIGGAYTLMKYEKHGTGLEMHYSHRVNRHTSVVTSNWLFAKTEEEKQDLKARESREWKRHKGNIYGTHQLDFRFDEEFELFLPSSASRDMFLTLARETVRGEVVPVEDILEVVTDYEAIIEELRGIVRPGYYVRVVEPFLKSECTSYQTPSWSKPWFRSVNLFTLWKRFDKETQDLKHNSFVYVGCKEEVYLLGLARGPDYNPYKQGTYTTSTKPLFYFSNNHLDFVSRHDAEMPKFEGEGMFNCAEYRNYDIAGFDDGPFIFPQMGRKQDCKNTVFTGEPELITGDVDEALEHFKKTDFAEFSDVVQRYADTVQFIHVSFGKPNGKFFY